MATVGVIVNPAAGKDIRRLVSLASPTSDMAKIGIVRRAVTGAIEGGARRLLVADDRHALARRAVAKLDLGGGGVDGGVEIEVIDQPLLSTGRDTQRAAAAMAAAGIGAVVVLGGDGTHRDVAKGWRHAPLVGISTGTNNVFPRALEATTAGQAAGLVATGRARRAAVGRSAKVIDVSIARADGSVEADLALVDVALTSSSFTGSRAVWDVSALREVVSVIAEPATVGLSAIGAAIDPVGRWEPGGIAVTVAAGCGSVPVATVRCPIAPGTFADVPVGDHHRLGSNDVVSWVGPGTLSFDGEREVVLAAGDRVELTVAGDGPTVIEPRCVLAAEQRDRAGGGVDGGNDGGNDGRSG